MQLVTLDVDGTLIRSTVFQAAAEGLGLAAEVEYWDELYFSDVISLETTFLAEYELFLDRPLAEVQVALREGPWLPDIPDTVDRLRGAGLDVWLLTDQPDWALTSLARSADLDEGVFTRTRRWGDKIGPVDDQVFDKWPALAEKLDAEGLSPEEVCHVGNGSNDVPVFEHVGRAVAFNPDDETVAHAADASVPGKRLGEILEPLARWVDGLDLEKR